MQSPLRLPITPAIALLCVSFAAGADVIDLSQGGRRSSGRPASFVLKAEGGSDNAPHGRLGGALSYLNEDALVELEAGAGAGFPGLQLGFSVRKLLGEMNDFFVFELSIAGNGKVTRGRDALDPAKGSHVWENIGLGFEHRTSFWSLTLTGGGTFLSLSQTPQAYVHAGLGLGF